jgi:hypothetical protein
MLNILVLLSLFQQKQNLGEICNRAISSELFNCSIKMSVKGPDISTIPQTLDSSAVIWDKWIE